MNKTQLLSRLSCCILLLFLVFTWPAHHTGWSDKKIMEMLSILGVVICVFPSGLKLNNPNGQRLFDSAFFALGISLLVVSNYLRYFK